MFMVDSAVAASIRKAWDEGGEASAVSELRLHYPAITGAENAARCVRAILSWAPLEDRLPLAPPKAKGAPKSHKTGRAPSQ